MSDSSDDPQLEAFFDLSLDLLCVAGTDGFFKKINPAFTKTLGYSPEELLGQPFGAFIHPDDVAATGEQVARMAGGKESIRFVNRYLHKDGSYRSIEWNAAADQEGNIYACARDITERLLEDDRFRRVVESSPNGIIMADAKGRITLVNKRAEELFGYSREEFLALTIEDLVPRKVQGGHAKLREGYMKKPEVRSMGVGRDLFARRKDGSEFPVEIGLTPMETPEGPAVLSSVVDITERKAAEDRLAAYSSELERSNSELQDFASVASHDLQEPLRKIQTFGQRLAADSGDGLSDRGKDYLGRMTSAAERMHVLLNDLLSFSRVTTKAQPYEEISLDEVLDGVLSDLEVAVSESGAEIERAPLPVIEADASQIRQVFQNLIGNALKFTPDGESPRIKITSEDGKEGDCEVVFLTFRDEGIGFDDQFADKIFTIFQRLHGKSEYPGTGVGLAICRKIAERHGGSISAQSQPGSGATFLLTLPRTQNRIHFQI